MLLEIKSIYEQFGKVQFTLKVTINRKPKKKIQLKFWLYYRDGLFQFPNDQEIRPLSKAKASLSALKLIELRTYLKPLFNISWKNVKDLTQNIITDNDVFMTLTLPPPV
ncbi:5280_t:CDS:2 [Rhizophagus irregularis]|nr:5280_t:CDS:2 [Rhizophagus irregularis]